MIKSYDVQLLNDKDCNWITVDIGFSFYAALLELYDKEFSSFLHETKNSPINQYVYKKGGKLFWRINALGDLAVKKTDDVIYKLKEIFIKRINTSFKVGKVVTNTITDEMDLFSMNNRNRYTKIHIMTPISFKSDEKYICLPTCELIIRNLISKWNISFPNLQIEDEDGEGISEIIRGIIISDYKLQSTKYYIKGVEIPSFTGEMVIKNTLNGAHKQILDAILAFSQYSGIGIKTSLGMGGIDIIE